LNPFRITATAARGWRRRVSPFPAHAPRPPFSMQRDDGLAR